MRLHQHEQILHTTVGDGALAFPYLVGRIDRGSPTSSCFRLVYAESERQIRMKSGTLRRSGNFH